ncbi:MAG: hypothetical protein JNL21_09510 [Myxococcales bacterium]|nr:hypothetical protein [Myxococcales bacterium]
MSLLLPKRRFASLSVKDLLDAREAYHTHLLHLENVIATAIGRYRFVKSDPRVVDGLEPADGQRGRDEPRTLENSEVRTESWPCVMVFVDKWIPRAEFARKVDEIVPPRLYLPDGRVVPTCVIYAEQQDEPIDTIQTPRFPETLLGGGYPSLAEVQEQTRLATIACRVTDGDTLYALTNAHVAGDAGRELFTLVRGRRELLGRTAAGKRLTKVPFEKAYPGLAGPRSVLNLDAALVRIEDATRWTSQVYGIGQFDALADLNVDTVSLDLINCEVRAFGAASELMRGEIQGLFYRYRSTGGQDQLADLLIGPRPSDDKSKLAHAIGRHGNSGALWFLEQKRNGEGEAPVLRPLALHWGGQRFVSGDGQRGTQYALASSLGVICRELDVEVVRNINLGQPERWGQVGHYKVGQLACRVATAANLRQLLERNEDRISYSDDILGERAEKTDDFIPLADVSDLVWKAGGQSVRGSEGPNHFADMDQPSAAFDGKTMLELSEDADFLDPQKWNEFYESLDIPMRHRGLLPFRAWQLFDAMVAALQRNSLAGYIGAAGVLAHYVGDACQPLHVSMFHDGEPNGRGAGVHSAYETKMLNRFAADLNARVEAIVVADPPATRRIRSGKEAARALLGLMTRSIRAIPPKDIIDVYEDNNHRVADLWTSFGDETAARLVDGATVLASLWRGAWEAADGETAFSQNQLRAIPLARLSSLYLDTTWVPSVTIARMSVVGGELVVDAS